MSIDRSAIQMHDFTTQTIYAAEIVFAKQVKIYQVCYGLYGRV